MSWGLKRKNKITYLEGHKNTLISWFASRIQLLMYLKLNYPNSMFYRNPSSIPVHPSHKCGVQGVYTQFRRKKWEHNFLKGAWFCMPSLRSIEKNHWDYWKNSIFFRAAHGWYFRKTLQNLRVGIQRCKVFFQTLPVFYYMITDNLNCFRTWNENFR